MPKVGKTRGKLVVYRDLWGRKTYSDTRKFIDLEQARKYALKNGYTGIQVEYK